MPLTKAHDTITLKSKKNIKTWEQGRSYCCANNNTALHEKKESVILFEKGVGEKSVEKYWLQKRWLYNTFSVEKCMKAGSIVACFYPH